MSYGALGSYRALVSNSLLVASGEISFLEVADNYEKHSKVPPWGTPRIWRQSKPLNERSEVFSFGWSGWRGIHGQYTQMGRSPSEECLNAS